MTDHVTPSAVTSRITPARISAVLGLVLVVLAIFSLTIVESGQVGVVTRSGSDQIRVISEPGVYPRWPFVERVWLLDTRLQLSEQHEARTLTAADKQALQLAGWVAWRIADPMLFNTATASGKNPVHDKVLQAFNETLESWLTQHPATALLTGPAEADLTGWRTTLNQRLAPLGIQVEGLGLRQVGLADAANAIYERMSAVRTRSGQQLMEGLDADERQLTDMQRRQQAQVLDEAYRAAQQVRQNAESELLAAYARQYGSSNGFANALKNPSAATQADQ